MTYPYRTLILVTLALVAYALPWVITDGLTALSQGAYDIAEWTSIHPVVRASNPTMLTSFLLRLPLTFLAIVVGFSAPTPILKSGWWWLAAIAVLVITASSLPPLEFFTGSSERNDPNYQQQFYHTVVGFAGGIFGLSGLVKPVRPYVRLVAAIGAAVSGIIGITRATDVMQDLMLPAQIGPGVTLFIITALLLSMDAIWIGIKKSS